MIELIQTPWSWWFSGIMISAVMFLLILGSKTFGFSSNLRTLCSALGAGKTADFFRFNWRKEIWNLVFACGALIGGMIAALFMGAANRQVKLSESAQKSIEALGIQLNAGLLPAQIFSLEALGTWQAWLILAAGGFMIGFGSRWAGGCTSGHAISGLSNLQLPSLIAVCGFFAGGLLMTWVILPIIMPLLFS